MGSTLWLIAILLTATIVSIEGCTGEFAGPEKSEDSPLSNRTQQCPELCLLRPHQGICRAYMPRLFFNSTSGQCERFIYGGCGGNLNNFKLQKTCKSTCANKCPEFVRPGGTRPPGGIRRPGGVRRPGGIRRPGRVWRRRRQRRQRRYRPMPLPRYRLRFRPRFRTRFHPRQRQMRRSD